MEKFTQSTKLFEKLYMEDVIFSYIVNDRKNFKGLYLHNLIITLENNLLFLSDDSNFEFVYPINDIIDIIYDECNNNFTFTLVDGSQIEITIT